MPTRGARRQASAAGMPTGGCDVQAEQPSDPPAYPGSFKPLLDGRPLPQTTAGSRTSKVRASESRRPAHPTGNVNWGAVWPKSMSVTIGNE